MENIENYLQHFDNCLTGIAVLSGFILVALSILAIYFIIKDSCKDNKEDEKIVDIVSCRSLDNRVYNLEQKVNDSISLQDRRQKNYIENFDFLQQQILDSYDELQSDIFDLNYDFESLKKKVSDLEEKSIKKMKSKK